MELGICNLSRFLVSFGFLSSEPKLGLCYNNSLLYFLVLSPLSSMWISSSFLYINCPVHVFILSHFKSFMEVGRVQIINKMTALVLLLQSRYWFIFGVSLLLPSNFFFILPNSFIFGWGWKTGIRAKREYDPQQKPGCIFIVSTIKVLSLLYKYFHFHISQRAITCLRYSITFRVGG